MEAGAQSGTRPPVQLQRTAVGGQRTPGFSSLSRNFLLTCGGRGYARETRGVDVWLLGITADAGVNGRGNPEAAGRD